MTACGLDFGTSNTTLGVVGGNGPRLIPLEADETTLPSAVFYAPQATAPRIGRDAIAAYVEGEDGRLMRSLKSVLGSALIEEVTRVGRRRLAFRDVIAGFLGAARRRAETAFGAPLGRVVHGRPVFFVDGDPEGDRKAEAALAEIAAKIGFAEISFQYEPIAAALDYERQVSREEIALIADIGGGTSDYSIVRIGPGRHRRDDRAGDILANDGVRIGGTDFDRELSLRAVMPAFGFGSPLRRRGLSVPNGYFHDLATWSSINRMYDPKVVRELHEVRREAGQPRLLDRLIHLVEGHRGHTLAMQVEAAKIALAARETTQVDLGWLEPDLAIPIDRAGLVAHTRNLADRVAARVSTCLAQAGLSADGIDAVFLTGGSTRLAHVRAAILATVPAARVVDGDTFGSVGMGLALEAARRYG